MKTLFFIKDVRANEFYARYRLSEGFIKEINEATAFDSEDELWNELQQQYLEELFSGKFLEIIKVYSL